jgi:hypothetical protein
VGRRYESKVAVADGSMAAESARGSDGAALEGSGRSRSLAEQALLIEDEDRLPEAEVEASPLVVLTLEGARQLNGLTEGIEHDFLGLVRVLLLRQRACQCFAQSGHSPTALGQRFCSLTSATMLV